MGGFRGKMESKMQALATAPPVTVSGITLFNAPMEDWVYIVTIIYTLLQISLFLRNRFREIKPKKG